MEKRKMNSAAARQPQEDVGDTITTGPDLFKPPVCLQTKHLLNNTPGNR